LKAYKLCKQYRTVVKFPNVYKSKVVCSLYANLMSDIYNKSRLYFTCVPVWLHGYWCIHLLGYENCSGCIYLEDFLQCSIPTPWPVQLFGEPSHLGDTAHCLGVILDQQLTWSTHIDQVRKKVVQRLGVLGRLLNRGSGLFIRNGVLLYKQLICPVVDYVCPICRSTTCAHAKKLQASIQVFALLLVHPGTLVTGKFMRIWELHSLLTTSEL
jgi:hypothetical protein